MKLYYSPGACSLSPHIVAREAGLEISLERVDLSTKQLASGGDYRQINPKGYVPALELDNGVLLTEGPAIVQYLADQRPEAGLAPPAGTLARYQLQEWLAYINGELHKPFGQLFKPATSAEQRQECIELLGQRFDHIAGVLERQPYLLGESLSVADIYLFVVLSWTAFLNIDLARWPSLQRFVGRLRERPAVQAAMKAEGLS